MPIIKNLRPNVIVVVSVPERINGFTGVLVTSTTKNLLLHVARRFWSHCLNLLKADCSCIICLITILKFFDKNVIKLCW